MRLTDVMRIAFLALFLASPAAGQPHWSGFRNGGSGLAEYSNAPTEWSPNTNIPWQVNVPGYGQSSPVVWGATVFVTSTDGPWQEHCFVHAYDLPTGKRLWTREVKATTRVENYFRNSRAAPSPVVDANRVVSFFPAGDVTAMNHEGEVLWSTALFKRFGEAKNERGTASSLAQTEELVLAVIDHDGPSYAVALSKQDGNVVWRTDRGHREPSWSSPVVAKCGESDLLIISSSQTVDAYDAATGRELWSVPGLQGNLIPSATLAGNALYVGSTQMHHGNLDADAVAASNCRIDLTAKSGQPGYRVNWNAKQVNAYYASPLSIA